MREDTENQWMISVLISDLYTVETISFKWKTRIFILEIIIYDKKPIFDRHYHDA